MLIPILNNMQTIQIPILIQEVMRKKIWMQIEDMVVVLMIIMKIIITIQIQMLIESRLEQVVVLVEIVVILLTLLKVQGERGRVVEVKLFMLGRREGDVKSKFDGLTSLVSPLSDNAFFSCPSMHSLLS